ncbi:MAG TPA: class I SAM-dependent methyltransferase [Candidatus Acidoferrales bacterium]|nr:class I SAM-dependent methyltransferase [Candidatus Acidoferrales bacterium]
MPDSTLLSHRQRVEAAVYDARTREHFAALTDAGLVVDAARPPFPNRDHVDFLGFALDRLQPLAIKRVLEAGCGTGALSVYLALRGARVTGVDVSAENIALARRRAAVSGAEVDFRAVAVELLDDADASYDAIIGNQVLHHFELGEAMPNLRRLLRPGGQAVFCEPVLLVPDWLRRIRDSRAVTRFLPRLVDTPTERSISPGDVEVVRGTFPELRLHPFQLLTRIANFRPLGDAGFGRLSRVDRFLLKRVPPCRRACRYAVFELCPDPTTKESNPTC